MFHNLTRKSMKKLIVIVDGHWTNLRINAWILKDNKFHCAIKDMPRLMIYARRLSDVKWQLCYENGLYPIQYNSKTFHTRQEGVLRYLIEQKKGGTK